jgi:RNA polymerase sigma-70 factor (ECF subfamily)
MEDKIAISLLKQGNLNALEHLVNRYQTRAVHAAYMIIFDQSLSEDVAQSAFLKVTEHIHQFDETRPFAPWFFRIVLNDALKIAKKQKKDVSLEEELDKSATQLAEWLTDPAIKPERLVEKKESDQIVLKAVQSLPPEQRAVIVMRYVLEMSEAEMALKINRPLSTIKWRLRDARKRLYNLIKSTK